MIHNVVHPTHIHRINQNRGLPPQMSTASHHHMSHPSQQQQQQHKPSPLPQHINVPNQQLPNVQNQSKQMSQHVQNQSQPGTLSQQPLIMHNQQNYHHNR